MTIARYKRGHWYFSPHIRKGRKTIAPVGAIKKFGDWWICRLCGYLSATEHGVRMHIGSVHKDLTEKVDKTLELRNNGLEKHR